jgi:bacillithiol system protein YtxJ
MFSFISKFRNKLHKFKQYNSYKHLLKDYKLEDINFMSSIKKVLIFKHSKECIISRKSMDEFIKFYKFNPDRFYYIVVDVIENRDLSKKIADDYKIIHQSPQTLLIQNNKCIYNESHSNINFNDINKSY